MKHILLSILFACLGFSCGENTVQALYSYAVAETPWSETLGNHRAVLTVAAPADAVRLSFDWRRPDKEVEDRCFLIIDAETGDTIPCLRRLRVDNEQ